MVLMRKRCKPHIGRLVKDGEKVETLQEIVERGCELLKCIKPTPDGNNEMVHEI